MSVWNMGVSQTLCAQIQSVVEYFVCSKCLYCFCSLRFWSLMGWRTKPGAATACARMSGCPSLTLGVLSWQLWGKHPRALTPDISYSPGNTIRTTALMSCSTVHPSPFFLGHNFDKVTPSFFCVQYSQTAVLTEIPQVRV